MKSQLQNDAASFYRAPINSKGGDSWWTSLLLACEECRSASMKSKKEKSWRSGKCKMNAGDMLQWPNCGWITCFFYFLLAPALAVIRKHNTTMPLMSFGVRQMRTQPPKALICKIHQRNKGQWVQSSTDSHAQNHHTMLLLYSLHTHSRNISLNYWH